MPYARRRASSHGEHTLQRCGARGAAVITTDPKTSAALYLSGEAFAANREALESAKIAAIVACGCRARFAGSFEYLEVNLSDSRNAKVGRWLDPAADFIASHLCKGEPVLVHCKAGICRSTTMVIAWLVKHGGMRSVDDALALIRQARHCVNPRPEFISALHAFAERHAAYGAEGEGEESAAEALLPPRDLEPPVSSESGEEEAGDDAPSCAAPPAFAFECIPAELLALILTLLRVEEAAALGRASKRLASVLALPAIPRESFSAWLRQASTGGWRQSMRARRLDHWREKAATIAQLAGGAWVDTRPLLGQYRGGAIVARTI